MNVEIGTVATLFLFWQRLFRIFGIGSLQCDHIIGFSTIVIFRKFRADILNGKVMVPYRCQWHWKQTFPPVSLIAVTNCLAATLTHQRQIGCPFTCQLTLTPESKISPRFFDKFKLAKGDNRYWVKADSWNRHDVNSSCQWPCYNRNNNNNYNKGHVKRVHALQKWFVFNILYIQPKEESFFSGKKILWNLLNI